MRRFAAILAGLMVALLALPSTVLAQAGPATTEGALAAAALTPILAWASNKIYDGVKTIIPFYDHLSSVIHQALAPLLGFALGWISSVAGVPNITELAGIDAGWVNGLLNAALMAGIFRYEKSKHAGDATAKLDDTRG